MYIIIVFNLGHSSLPLIIPNCKMSPFMDVIVMPRPIMNRIKHAVYKEMGLSTSSALKIQEHAIYPKVYVNSEQKPFLI